MIKVEKSIKIHKRNLAFEINLGLLSGWFDRVEMWVLGANNIDCSDIHNLKSQKLDKQIEN